MFFHILTLCTIPQFTKCIISQTFRLCNYFLLDVHDFKLIKLNLIVKKDIMIEYITVGILYWPSCTF